MGLKAENVFKPGAYPEYTYVPEIMKIQGYHMNYV